MGMCTGTYTFCTHLMFSHMSKNKQVYIHPQNYPHLLYVHTPESSCLMLAAFVPAQRQWEPACWQIIPLQPPLSNGKNAAASSSSPLGGNLPSHITDNKPHCCCFAEKALWFLHTYEDTHTTQTKKTLLEVSERWQRNHSSVAIRFSFIQAWLPHLIAFLLSEKLFLIAMNCLISCPWSKNVLAVLKWENNWCLSHVLCWMWWRAFPSRCWSFSWSCFCSWWDILLVSQS